MQPCGGPGVKRTQQSPRGSHSPLLVHLMLLDNQNKQVLVMGLSACRWCFHSEVGPAEGTNVDETEAQGLDTRGITELTESTPWLPVLPFIHHLAASEPTPVCTSHARATSTMTTTQSREGNFKS